MSVTQTTTVRRITEEDFPAVTALLAELGRPALAPATEARVRAVYGRLVADANGAAMIAEANGRAVGFCSLHFRDRFNQPTPEAWIPDLVVTESARGTGVGKALLQAAMAAARARGCHRLTLESGHTRTVAHRFYALQGLEDAGKYFQIEL